MHQVPAAQCARSALEAILAVTDGYEPDPERLPTNAELTRLADLILDALEEYVDGWEDVEAVAVDSRDRSIAGGVIHGRR